MTGIPDDAVEIAARTYWDQWDVRKDVDKDAMRAALAAAAPEIIATALEELARDIYNGPPDPTFPNRQTFYNEGVSPWLEDRARIARQESE